ncbi:MULTISPECIES: ABC transporter permease [Bacillota]|uniref:ABC transporter permease n=1 Tax=Bacillota TaxID=1239 RepID=UPI003F99622F
MNNKKIKETIFRYGTVIFFIGLLIFFSIKNPKFMSFANITNILRQISVIGIATVGMTMIIITGGIDLSIGSTIALTSVIMAKLLVSGIGIIPAILITLLAGAVLGMINALLINKINIPPLIATLGTVTIYRGIAYIITGGMSVYGFPESFRFIGQGYIGILPAPVLIQIMVYGIGFFILYKTAMGRHIYGIGSNEGASYLSGINVKKVKYFVYTISGILGAVAGIVTLSRINSGLPNTATGFELDVVTAVVLGGISVKGGEGHLAGSIIGCLIIGVLANGMIFLDIEEYYQMLVKGIVLIGALGIDINMKRNNKETIYE